MKHKSVIRIVSTEVARLTKSLEEIQQRTTKLEALKFQQKRQKRIEKKRKKLPKKEKVVKEDVLLMKITAAVKLEKRANLVKSDLMQIEEFAKALKEAEVQKSRQKQMKAMDGLPEIKSHLGRSVFEPYGIPVKEVRKSYIRFWRNSRILLHKRTTLSPTTLPGNRPPRRAKRKRRPGEKRRKTSPNH
ncbi:hypothetical protein L596_000863 [Steinernema carpocapsae]|uniref:Uncharacterized protein n=1 Tax=Steinernema carpocapsae TaxID=34508 RepID=A0A4U8ULU5_STECR|nr:hypothetical protein L596_000862 [Steinernema carpocapsae]TMS33087.1 hypothetical protein L596_000863 [Steinernema carpocapsae]